MKEECREVFEFILYSVDYADVDKPIKYEECCDPNSVVVCLVLYLYSIEPPFYAYINKACKEQDKTKLKTLGPIVRVLYQILVGGGTESSREDRITTGQDRVKCKVSLGFYSESFILFRGAAMREQTIKEW